MDQILGHYGTGLLGQNGTTLAPDGGFAAALPVGLRIPADKLVKKYGPRRSPYRPGGNLAEIPRLPAKAGTTSAILSRAWSGIRLRGDAAAWEASRTCGPCGPRGGDRPQAGARPRLCCNPLAPGPHESCTARTRPAWATFPCRQSGSLPSNRPGATSQERPASREDHPAQHGNRRRVNAKHAGNIFGEDADPRGDGRRAVGFEGRPHLPRGNLPATAEDAHPLKHVLQMPHVARPVVGHQHFCGVRRKPPGGAPFSADQSPRKKLPSSGMSSTRRLRGTVVSFATLRR